MTRDEFLQRLDDFAYTFRKVATDKLRGTPWLFWALMMLASLPVAALLWWLL